MSREPSDRRRRQEDVAVDRRRGDRRRWSRLPVHLWAEATDGEATYFNQATDLSAGGVFFASAIPHPVGTVVALKLELPDGGEPLACRGVVVNAEEGAAPGMGVWFLDLDPSVAARIEGLLAGGERAD